MNDAGPALANGRVMDVIVVPRISAGQNVAGIVPCYSHDTSRDGLVPLSAQLVIPKWTWPIPQQLSVPASMVT